MYNLLIKFVSNIIWEVVAKVKLSALLAELGLIRAEKGPSG